MPAPSAYARRQFPGAAADTTITATVNSAATSVALASTSGWPTGAYTGGILVEFFSTSTGLTIDKAWATDLTGSTLTIVRNADGATATTLASGTGVRPAAGAIDADEANRAVAQLLAKATTAGQLLYVSAAQVYTALGIGAAGRVMISDGSIPAWVALSGDVTVGSTGVTAIGSGKVTSAMIVDGTIVAGDIASNAVTTVKILDANVTTAKLADDAVALAKVDPAAKPRWMVGPFARSLSDGTGALAVGASGPTQIPIPEACAIIGVSVAGSGARASGSGSFEVTLNGSGTGHTTAIDGTHTQYATNTQAETADAVTAGQRVGVTFTNSVLVGPDQLTAYVLLQAV